MQDKAPDSKQKAILNAAWDAFAAYGFRKTSMDDIAHGAGMSRPALYLRYRNKEDILRSLVQGYYDRAASDVAAALAGTGPVADRLNRAFLAQGGPLAEVMLTSPHGMELMDS
ncbi:MAG: TetR/AcrR family transcriptional regulator, partial [Marinibacterium sp.]